MRAQRGPRVIALGALLAVAAAGCQRCGSKALPPPDPCAGEVRGRFELRDASGTLLLSLRPLPAAKGEAQGEILCDGEHRRVGRYVRGPNPAGRALDLLDDKGAPVARVMVGNAADGDPRLIVGKATGEEALRLHDAAGLLRILDGQGVPVGQVGRVNERAIAFNPGGKPIATARAPEGETGDKLAIYAPAGEATHFTLGLRSDRAAAAFALDGLPLPARFVLARYLDGEQ